MSPWPPEVGPSDSERLLEPQRDQIRKWLVGETEDGHPLKLTKIHELLERRGFHVTYISLYRFAVKRCGFGEKSSTVRVADVAPGELAEIDFGRLGLIQDDLLGRRRVLWALVVTLVHSRHQYVHVTHSQKLEDVIGGLEDAWEFFGGVSARVVVDNLRAAICKPDRYDPIFNRVFEEYSRHRGFVIDPAPRAMATGKAKAESGVLLAQRWLLARLRDQTFFSIEELNQAIRELLEDFNDRSMQKLGVSRRQLWEQLDRPALKSLPLERYEMGEWSKCRVNIDYHIEVNRHVYSVPYQLLREQVEARSSVSIVEIYYKGRRITSHRRRYDHRPSTKPEHMPRSHRAHSEWTPSRLINWAEKSGPATGRLVAEILRSRPHPEQGYRACLGLMRLGRRYGEQRLEAASLRAEHLRSYSYRTVKNILSSAQDRLPFEPENPSVPATPVHDNIRGADYYAAHEEESC